MSYLKVDNVSKHFKSAQENIHVLSKIDFEANLGETISITGPSGSGKSTFLNILGLLEPATEGTISLNNQKISGLSEDKRAKFRSQNIGFVFQDHHLLPQLNIFENVLLPGLISPQTDISDKAHRLIEFVGLKERKTFFPGQISGGERQRAAIARGLMSNGSLLLCDEPTGNLDNENGSKIISLLKDIAKEKNIIVIMVTHNANYAQQFSRTCQLINGSLQEEKSND